MFHTTGSLAGARFAVTDRRGGRSRAPYDALNLGGHVGDAPEAVHGNRDLVAAALGMDTSGLTLMQQVHGADVAVVTGEPGAEHGTGYDAPSPRAAEADAMVTAVPGRPLTVLVADCTPVLLASDEPALVAVAHAGRRGLEAGVVAATVAAMERAGASPERIEAYVGPAVCGRCYEVPPDLQAQVCRTVPQARATTREGRPALDIRAGVAAQLRSAGLRQVRVDPACTAESGHLYSYRRDGVTGRFAGIAWLPSPPTPPTPPTPPALPSPPATGERAGPGPAAGLA